MDVLIYVLRYLICSCYNLQFDLDSGVHKRSNHAAPGWLLWEVLSIDGVESLVVSMGDEHHHLEHLVEAGAQGLKHTLHIGNSKLRLFLKRLRNFSGGIILADYTGCENMAIAFPSRTQHWVLLPINCGPFQLLCNHCLKNNAPVLKVSFILVPPPRHPPLLRSNGPSHARPIVHARQLAKGAPTTFPHTRLISLSLHFVVLKARPDALYSQCPRI